MRVITGIAALAECIGSELGVSEWVEVDQTLIDRFADVTRDHQWIHTDPVRAIEGPFGRTVAHGLLTLALLPSLSTEVFRIAGVAGRVNYGYDRVRFPSPVPVGARLRDRIIVSRVEEVAGGARAHLRHTVEIEGQDRPACVADSIVYLVVGE